MEEERFVKYLIYPQATFPQPNPQKRKNYKVIPCVFRFKTYRITVDEVLDCERAPARKCGGVGLRYVCKVSWEAGDKTHTKTSLIWFDPAKLQWFVELPESAAPKEWEAASQLPPEEGI